MTRIANTPAVFIDSNRMLFHDGVKGEALVALSARLSVDKGDGRELCVTLLDEPAGRDLLRVYGTPEGLAALGLALVDLVAMVAAAPLDLDDVQRASIIHSVDDAVPPAPESAP